MFSRDEMQRAIEDALKSMEGVALELYRRGREEAREELEEARARNADMRAMLEQVTRERDEARAELAILRPWSVMLKRAHGALTDAGCVVPLEFDQSIEHAINDLARRATRAEQLFVDEYDARKAAEREIAELKARITTLEAMKP